MGKKRRGPWGSCGRKVRYPDEHSARKQAGKAYDRDQRGAERLRAYECPHCGGWHLTSHARRKRPAALSESPVRRVAAELHKLREQLAELRTRVKALPVGLERRDVERQISWLGDAGGERCEGRSIGGEPRPQRLALSSAGGALANADRGRGQRQGVESTRSERAGRTVIGGDGPRFLAHAHVWRREIERIANRSRNDESAPRNELDGRDLPDWPPGPADVQAWRELPRSAQPALCPVDDGLPPYLVRPALRATGNAVAVPVGEVIGGVVRAILAEHS